MHKLQHKNIVQLYEVFEDKDYIYLVQEFIIGGDLQTMIKSKKHLNEIEAAKIIERLLTTIEFCHDNGIIHRDI